MYYTRAMGDCWRQADEQFPVLLLTGPRQVGKTTLLRHLCGHDRRYVTLDDPSVRTLARDDPALFLQRFEAPVLIDEIQYAPQLLPLIKMAVDARRKPGQFWLTGSQHFQMMKEVSETLAGRVAILHLLGFSGRERGRRALEVPPFLPTRDVLRQHEVSAGETNLRRAYEEIWLGSFPALIAGPVRDRDLFYQLLPADLPPAGRQGPGAGGQRNGVPAIPEGNSGTHGTDPERCRDSLAMRM